MTVEVLDILGRACYYANSDDHAAALATKSDSVISKARDLIRQGMQVGTAAAVAVSLVQRRDPA
jgi:hypothetical protein